MRRGLSLEEAPAGMVFTATLLDMATRKLVPAIGISSACLARSC